MTTPIHGCCHLFCILFVFKNESNLIILAIHTCIVLYFQGGISTDFINNNSSLAVVTAQGIIFREKKYTCPLAISEQWFSLNSPYYMLKIPVIYAEEHNTLCIILDTGDLIKVQLLSDTMKLPQTDLEDYYFKLNQLKLENNKRKHVLLKRRK